MKTKTLIIVGVLLVAIFFVANSNFVQASFGDGFPTNTSESNYRYGMMGGYGYGMMGGYYDEDDYCYYSNEDLVSYEWLYAHLSEDDQSTVDLKYLELAALVDFSILNLEEQQTAIDNIKIQLVTFITENDFTLEYHR